jgi:hypothetical protein
MAQALPTGSEKKVSWVRSAPGAATRCTWLVAPKRVVISIDPSGSQSSNVAAR